MVAKTLSLIRRIREYTNISLQPYKKIKTLASGLFLILLHQGRIRKLKYSNVSSDELPRKDEFLPKELCERQETVEPFDSLKSPSLFLCTTLIHFKAER